MYVIHVLWLNGKPDSWMKHITCRRGHHMWVTLYLELWIIVDLTFLDVRFLTHDFGREIMFLSSCDQYAVTEFVYTILISTIAEIFLALRWEMRFACSRSAQCLAYLQSIRSDPKKPICSHRSNSSHLGAVGDCFLCPVAGKEHWSVLFFFTGQRRPMSLRLGFHSPLSDKTTLFQGMLYYHPLGK